MEQDPVTAYVVAYDAARHAAVALLAEQDLRVTAEGGHLAVEQALSAQFGGLFSSFSRLRQRRNELDYPVGPEDFAGDDEAAAAIETSTEIVDNAERILAQGILTRF